MHCVIWKSGKVLCWQKKEVAQKLQEEEKKNQRIPLSTNTFDKTSIANHVSSGLTKQNVGERSEVSRLNTAHLMTATCPY